MQCTLLLTLLVFLASSATAQAPPFVLKWGSTGSGDGQFDFPRRLAVAADGTVYVSDRNNARIQKFTSVGLFIAKWGSLGTAPGEFDFPFGVAVTPANTFVYTAERNNNRIQKFSPNGAFIREWGSFGAGDGEFNFPIAVDVDSQGNVYVGDSFNHRIQKFNADGQFLGKWGSQGSTNGQFINPIGIAVDANGVVYVGDSGNHRVQKFTSSGGFLTAWGVQGTGDGEFQSPRGIGVDLAGNVYVADTINNRIQKFTSAGIFLAKWGTFGSADGQFSRPEDVESDGDGNLYVVDPSNNRVQKFAMASVPVTLLDLSLRRDGYAAVLSWRVSTVAVDHVAFVVMRESPGLTRRPVSSETLRGEHEYSFYDRDAPTTAAKYWLHEIADNGNSVMHGPVQLQPAAFPELTFDTPYPNPFNPSTTLAFTLSRPGAVRVWVVDASGHVIRHLASGTREASRYTLVWDGRDDAGSEASSGVYFARLDFAGRIYSQRVTLLK